MSNVEAIKSQYLSYDIHVLRDKLDLPDGITIPSDSMYAEVHLDIGIIRSGYELSNLSATQRANKVAEWCIDGLVSLAEKCEKDPEWAIPDYYTGTSHLVRPYTLKQFGFSVTKPTSEVQEEYRTRIENRLDIIYGADRAREIHIGQIHQFWVSREQLVKSLPLLRQKKAQINRDLK